MPFQIHSKSRWRRDDLIRAAHVRQGGQEEVREGMEMGMVPVHKRGRDSMDERGKCCDDWEEDGDSMGHGGDVDRKAVDGGQYLSRGQARMFLDARTFLVDGCWQEGEAIRQVGWMVQERG